jgi:hypothetical protein
LTCKKCNKKTTIRTKNSYWGDILWMNLKQLNLIVK